MDFSIVIPALNEAGNIQALIAEISDACGPTFNYEIVYVDDGSDDDTQEELRAAMSSGRHPLRVFRHKRRCGQSAAICTGVRTARGPWIVTMDADGQNDPADIPKLLACVRTPDRDPDLVLVTGQRARRRDNLVKRLSSLIANRIRRALLGDAVTDTGCGLKLFSRTAFLELPKFDHMHRFLPALFQRQGGGIQTVEVNHRPRMRGVSKYGIHNRLWVGIVDLFGVMWLKHRYPRTEYVEIQA